MILKQPSTSRLTGFLLTIVTETRNMMHQNIDDQIAYFTMQRCATFFKITFSTFDRIVFDHSVQEKKTKKKIKRIADKTIKEK